MIKKLEEINDSGEIEIVAYDKLEDFIELINKLDENYYDKDIIDIIKLIPKDNSVVLRKRIFEKIMEKTGLKPRELHNIEKSAQEQIEQHRSYIQNTLMEKWKEKLENKNEENEYIVYDNQIIELKEDEINLYSNWQPETNIYNVQYIAGFGLRILYKTMDERNHNIELYTFFSNDKLFNNYGVEDFLNIQMYKMAKGNFGKDIVRFIFKYKGEELPILEARYILGWKDRWVLPFVVDENGLAKYSFLCDTDEQKEVLKRSRKMYIEHSDEEKEKIIKYFESFIKQTQINPEYLAIIVGWSIIAPFKYYLIKTFGVLPVLILTGKKGAGKTHILDDLTTFFYGITETHEAGATARSPARYEDIISASTFPRMIDEFDDVSRSIVNITKENATDCSPYKRKSGAKHQMSRPKVSPICMTSQKLGDEFIDPANSSRAIVLDYNDSIVRDDNWVKMENKLRKLKLFSLIYDYTKDWINGDLDKLMDETMNKFNISSTFDKIYKEHKEFGKNYPRLREIYQIVLAGVLLFEKVFKIQLNTTKILDVLIKSRIGVSNNLVKEFISYILEADKYESIILKEDKEIVKNPKYLTCELVRDSNGVRYIQSINVRDFNELNKSNYKLKELAEQLREGSENKDYISSAGTYHCDTLLRSIYCFKISPNFTNEHEYHTNLGKKLIEDYKKKETKNEH